MNNLRGINKKLISIFKISPLSKLIEENKKEFLSCIRNNAIGIYYNADRVAMVSLDREGSLKCKINSYYLTGIGNGENITITPEKICESIEVIKTNSYIRSTLEKKAQQALVYSNNSNPESEWICLDIEYKQSTKIQSSLTAKFTGRFDIIAVSKTQPHRIAIVELKYNDQAIGGTSGIVKHLKDFYIFDNKQCIDNLKIEIRDILDNLTELECPESRSLPVIKDIKRDFFDNVEFYMICLYDSLESPRGKVGGYLFNTKHSEWGSKRTSKHNAENTLTFADDILPKVKFLFRKVANPTNLNISDILDFNNYEK